LVDKLLPAQGVGRHTFGGKKLHNDVIFPDFSTFRRTAGSTVTSSATSGAASVPAAPPVQAPEAPEPPSPERANHSSPDAETPGDLSGRLDAPPFSWLGGDAWPHFRA
jgi:hypothetical protein